ncbi:spermidine synthase [Lichenifustis flavocetrariae]|uniref:Spermidine synthase n=1 Tax=Lichenifustis flavocetrariae TaxID=2949735 RepID=A0AA42CN96_9HYPH|nr:spermidine synthase [Lichenifustis flavocetrariae]MCW6509155.1 spermidine synthase [Lichenifustis flavocetrariae]
MQYWTLIEAAPIPGSTEELRLMQRGTEFAINLGRELLMGSRMRGSEEALARLGCADALTRGTSFRLLIGGLGMGFTLRAALDLLGPAASVEVAELVTAVVGWVRGPLAHLSGDALADPRVRVHQADVAQPIRAARGIYDAILLDVDNGPQGLTRDGNEALYSLAGLRAAWTALAPGGALAVWSAFPDRAFSQLLARAGFIVAEHTVRAHGKKGARHMIWVAARPGRTA